MMPSPTPPPFMKGNPKGVDLKPEFKEGKSEAKQEFPERGREGTNKPSEGGMWVFTVYLSF